MAKEVTLVKGKYVIVGFPAEPIWMEQTGVIVVKDRIEEIGQADALKRKYSPEFVIGGNEYLIMPGMINAHHHGRGLSSFQMGSRDDTLESWIYEIWTEPSSDLYLNVLYGALQLIASGVTTVIHSHYHSPVEPENYLETAKVYLDAYNETGIRVNLALGIKDQNLMVYGEDSDFLNSLPSPLRESALWLSHGDISPDLFFKHFERLHNQYYNHSRMNVWLGPEGIQWCSDSLLKRISDTAEEFDVGIHMHAVESPLQRAYGEKFLGGKSLAHLDKIGFLSDRVSLAHGVWTSEDEFRVLARTGTSLIPNPSSNLRLHNGITPLAYLNKAGVNLAMGIDGMGINDDNDYFQEGRLGHLVNQMPGAPEFTTYDTLKMMTYGGARAARLSDCVGCLLPGYYADIVLARWDEMTFPYTHERQDPIDVLIYRGRARHVDTVMISGKVIYQDKKFVHHNLHQVARKLSETLSHPLKGSSSAKFQKLAIALRPYVEDYYANWHKLDSMPFYKPNSQ